MDKIKVKVVIKNSAKQTVVSTEGNVEPQHSPITGSPGITKLVKSAIKEIEGLRVGDTITITEVK